MDIRHLEYFIEIVNCKFNLSQASRKLMVSQPALSQIIKTFEMEENIHLFERYKGRLQNLTPGGMIFYKNALLIMENYTNMMEELRETALKIKGKIRIGMPPLILGIAFSEIISTMIADYPDIKFEIVEAGAVELSRALTSGDLDLAALTYPTELDSEKVNEYFLHESELVAFMSASNPLAKKEKLHWSDLDDQMLAILDSSFTIHHMLMEVFDTRNVQPKKTVLSGSWDFVLMSTKKSNFITILQSSIEKVLLLEDIVKVPFHDPLPWRLTICQTKKPRYSQIEKSVLKTIISHFNAD
jgi:DNA-binding transcriptional LysR family regulator